MERKRSEIFVKMLSIHRVERISNKEARRKMRISNDLEAKRRKCVKGNRVNHCVQ